MLKVELPRFVRPGLKRNLIVLDERDLEVRYRMSSGIHNQSVNMSQVFRPGDIDR
jgi:hypothetical protein